MDKGVVSDNIKTVWTYNENGARKIFQADMASEKASGKTRSTTNYVYRYGDQ